MKDYLPVIFTVIDTLPVIFLTGVLAVIDHLLVKFHCDRILTDDF